MGLHGQMNCWQAGRLGGWVDGWPVAQARLWEPGHDSPGSRRRLACGLRSADERKDGDWHGDGHGDGGGHRHRLGESAGCSSSSASSSFGAEAQRAEAAQTGRIAEPENYFQIGDLIVI